MAVDMDWEYFIPDSGIPLVPPLEPVKDCISTNSQIRTIVRVSSVGVVVVTVSTIVFSCIGMRRNIFGKSSTLSHLLNNSALDVRPE